MTVQKWDRAVAAYGRGEVEQAAEIAREMLAAQPADTRALYLLSLAAHSKGDVEQQFSFLTVLLDINPCHVEGLHAMGAILRIRGELAAAIGLCNRALAFRPAYANAHNTLGMCLLEQGNPRQAIQSFSQAVEIDPSLAAAYLNLGATYKLLGERQKAKACFERVVQLAPESAEAHETLGHIFIDERKRSEAIQCFARALALKPNSIKMLLQLAEAKGQTGSAQDSETLIERALALDPRSARALCLLGFKKQEIGEFKEAISAFEQSILIEPVQGDAYFGLFTSRRASHLDVGLMQQMLRTLTHKDLHPHARMQLHTALSKAFDDLGDYGQAVHHMDRASEIAVAQSKKDNRFDADLLSADVDKAIKAFTPDFYRKHAEWSLESSLPLMIVGLPRSGTTLVEQILSRHPEVQAGGELTFWTDVHAHVNGLAGLAFDRVRATNAAEAYLQVLNKIRTPNDRRVIDKMPNNFLYMGAIHLLLSGAKFIHCRRNPLDNCVSLYMTPYRNRPTFTRTREDILSFYMSYRKLMAHWVEVLPQDAILHVDYEEVVDDPELQTRRILEFCGLEWSATCLSPQENERVVSTPSRWQSRQPIYKSSVERWRNYHPWLGVFQQLLPGQVSCEE